MYVAPSLSARGLTQWSEAQALALALGGNAQLRRVAARARVHNSSSDVLYQVS
jgi:hypothetical protein